MAESQQPLELDSIMDMDVYPRLQFTTTSNSRKRGASPSLLSGSGPPKKLKEDVDSQASSSTSTGMTHQCTLADELAQELQCPCCSAIAHRPVVVMPFVVTFGSRLVPFLNGGTSCPSCRSVAQIAVPSRPLEIVIQTLIRACPDQARAEKELAQADQIYKQGGSLRFPSPREPSPEPNFNQSTDIARPCPTCIPHNQFGWTCPVPIPDPVVVGNDNAWSFEDGTPPGHTTCGNCDALMATNAPMSTRCDFCATSFCGIGVRGRCTALEVSSQNPEELNGIEDLLTCEELYEQCFDNNNVEVEILLDYLTSQRFKPRTIYTQIVNHIRDSPTGFQALIDDDVFPDAPMNEDGESIPRSRSCRDCARSIFIWGLRAWWIRERQKGFLDEKTAARPDCIKGAGCERQTESDHAKEFNHIIAFLSPANQETRPTASSSGGITAAIFTVAPSSSSSLVPTPIHMTKMVLPGDSPDGMPVSSNSAQNQDRHPRAADPTSTAV
ncbi:hypothetical protein DL96DRAFT_1712234 [Flagelloscypha sp. PMI_526]|nr:hypothetical protein DL96DRAFT_1712234 [Flagelloscypha sp. PMI_526]